MGRGGRCGGEGVDCEWCSDGEEGVVYNVCVGFLFVEMNPHVCLICN